MLLQHQNVNSNHAKQHQTTYLQHNRKNQSHNTKIAFPLQRKFLHRDLHISRSMVAQWIWHGFVNGAQLPSSPVPEKQPANQPKTKTADIESQ